VVSNYSGTYQPVAAFRARAALPADKFVPCQTAPRTFRCAAC
jgi:hypothetical protein